MSNSIVLQSSAATTTGVGSTKKKANTYAKGSNLIITVSSISAGGSLSGYLQCSENGTDFWDTCAITDIADTDVTATIDSFAARYEGSMPAFLRIRWVASGTISASAKVVFDD